VLAARTGLNGAGFRFFPRWFARARVEIADVFRWCIRASNVTFDRATAIRTGAGLVRCIVRRALGPQGPTRPVKRPARSTEIRITQGTITARRLRHAAIAETFRDVENWRLAWPSISKSFFARHRAFSFGHDEPIESSITLTDFRGRRWPADRSGLKGFASPALRSNSASKAAGARRPTLQKSKVRSRLNGGRRWRDTFRWAGLKAALGRRLFGPLRPQGKDPNVSGGNDRASSTVNVPKLDGNVRGWASWPSPPDGRQTSCKARSPADELDLTPYINTIPLAHPTTTATGIGCRS